MDGFLPEAEQEKLNSQRRRRVFFGALGGAVDASPGREIGNFLQRLEADSLLAFSGLPRGGLLDFCWGLGTLLA